MIRRYGTELRAAMMLADIAVTAVLAVSLSNAMLAELRTRLLGRGPARPDLRALAVRLRVGHDPVAPWRLSACGPAGRS